jgi:hypothetical protein
LRQLKEAQTERDAALAEVERLKSLIAKMINELETGIDVNRSCAEEGFTSKPETAIAAAENLEFALKRFGELAVEEKGRVSL